MTLLEKEKEARGYEFEVSKSDKAGVRLGRSRLTRYCIQLTMLANSHTGVATEFSPA